MTKSISDDETTLEAYANSRTNMSRVLETGNSVTQEEQGNGVVCDAGHRGVGVATCGMCDEIICMFCARNMNAEQLARTGPPVFMQWRDMEVSFCFACIAGGIGSQIQFQGYAGVDGFSIRLIDEQGGTLLEKGWRSTRLQNSDRLQRIRTGV